ncbi:MAG: hypothetical protein Q9224_006902, partial [Gallowayella concinna]
WTGFEAPAAPAIDQFNGMAQQYGIDNPMDTTNANDLIDVGAQLFKSAAKVSSNKLTGSQWRVIQALGRPAINTPNGMARRVRFADNVVDTTTAAIDTTTAPAINVTVAPQQLERTAATTTAPDAAEPPKRKRRRVHTDGVVHGKRHKGAPKLTEEQKRLNHLASEEARRENIQAPIDALCQIVPALSMDVSKSHAKVWVATRECAEWVKGERRRLTLALEARGINAREFLENREGVSH